MMSGQNKMPMAAATDHEQNAKKTTISITDWEEKCKREIESAIRLSQCAERWTVAACDLLGTLKSQAFEFTLSGVLGDKDAEAHAMEWMNQHYDIVCSSAYAVECLLEAASEQQSDAWFRLRKLLDERGAQA